MRLKRRLTLTLTYDHDARENHVAHAAAMLREFAYRIQRLDAVGPLAPLGEVSLPELGTIAWQLEEPAAADEVGRQAEREG